MIGFKVALTILRHIASLRQPPYPLFTSGLPCAPLPMADDLRAVADRRDFGAQVYCYHEGKMVMRTRVGKSLNPSHKKKTTTLRRACMSMFACTRTPLALRSSLFDASSFSVVIGGERGRFSIFCPTVVVGLWAWATGMFPVLFAPLL